MQVSHEEIHCNFNETSVRTDCLTVSEQSCFRQELFGHGFERFEAQRDRTPWSFLLGKLCTGVIK
jgi:hypothetical protein